MKDVLSKAGQIIQAVDNYVSDILIRYGKIATIGRMRVAICDKTAHVTSFLTFPSSIVPTHFKLYLSDVATFDTIKLIADPNTLQYPDNYEKSTLEKLFSG